MEQSDLKWLIIIIGGVKMIRFLNKSIKTYKVIKKHLPTLKKELLDLTGATKVVIEKIVEIWDK